MKINQKKCTRCKECIPYCPVGAIKSVHNKVIIDQNFCVECGVCLRSAICTYEAFTPLNRKVNNPLEWLRFRFNRKVLKIITRLSPRLYRLKKPRSIRRILSDPTVAFPLTNIYGRGTEEVKTNDVTRRYQWGEIGFCIEVGRPGIGATIREIQEFTVELARIGVVFLPANPISWMIKDSNGSLKARYLNERVLSAVIEFKIKEVEINKIFDFIRRFDRETKNVFTVGIISPLRTDGTIPIVDTIKQQGFHLSSHAKVNLGLGRRPEQKELR